MHAQHYLLCYDIADPKRLGRVHRAVSKLMWQLQYSVYYAEIMPDQIAALVTRLERLIDPLRDDIRVYAVEPLADAIRLGSCGTVGLAMFDRKGRSVWGGEMARPDADDAN